MRTRATIAAAALAVITVAATGCTSGLTRQASPSGASSATSTATATPAATKGHLVVAEAFLPKPPMTDMAAAYFTVRNTGSRSDHLDRVAVPGLSARVSTHTTRGDAMVPVNGYRVPPHGRLVLHRGGNHLMLMHLNRMPRVGEKVRARLFFAHAGEVDVTIPVVHATYTPPTHRERPGS